MGKFLVFIICLVSFVWCGVFGINMQNAKALKEPVVLHTEGDIQSAGTIRYDGLGYDYYVKTEISEELGVVITQTKMTFMGYVIGEAAGENALNPVENEEEELIEEVQVAEEKSIVEDTEIAEEEVEEELEEELVVVDTMVNLYYPDDQLMEMEIKLAPVSMTTTQDLVDAWLDMGGISDDIKVLSFSAGTINMSQEFADFIARYGTSGELLYLSGFAQTIKDYYGLPELYLTIEGEVLETGHSIYDFPL